MEKLKKDLEIRLYRAPNLRERQSLPIVNNLIFGIRDYLEASGIKGDLKEREYALVKDLVDSARIESEVPINSVNDYIDADKVLQSLGKEKVDIAHNFNDDIPHWDLILTPKHLNSREDGFVYGRTSNYISGDNSLASMIVSTADLKGDLMTEKAFLLGRRHATLTKGECSNKGCIASSKFDYRKLEKMAENYQKTKKIKTCGIKH